MWTFQWMQSLTLSVLLGTKRELWGKAHRNFSINISFLPILRMLEYADFEQIINISMLLGSYFCTFVQWETQSGRRFCCCLFIYLIFLANRPGSQFFSGVILIFYSFDNSSWFQCLRLGGRAIVCRTNRKERSGNSTKTAATVVKRAIEESLMH